MNEYTVAVNADHQTWIEVDLDAIAHNARELKRVIAPSLLCAVVKADGYGHGAVATSRAAIAGGANCLAVAFVFEGVLLRRAGIEVPILVLFEPAESEMQTLVEHRLTPNIYSERGADALSAAASGFEYECHVEVDTGLHRTGVDPTAIQEFRDYVQSKENLVISGVFMHYATADIPEHQSTEVQETRFTEVVSSLDVDPTKVIIHASNSAAAIRRPHIQFHMVRAGILVYGLTSNQFAPPEWIQPALSLKSRVGRVARVSAGESLSYGQRYKLARDSNIATIPIGYADGIPREAGNLGLEVLINKKRYVISGTVTMDQISVDCGDDAVVVGDEVVLIGTQGDESVIADTQGPMLGLTPLEFVTRLGPRVPRLYVGELAETLGD